MQLKRINSAIDRVGRNDINENFGILERTYGKTAIDAQEAKTISEQAKRNSDNAVVTSDDAMVLAESIQNQFNQVVIEGDSSVEAAQARVSVDATAYDTLKARLDAENTQVTQQLAQIKENSVTQLNSLVGVNNTKFIAHRGVNGIAPENSIPAFKLAKKYGFWGIECDVRRTSDGIWVLMHDETVDRTTNGTGKVSEMTYAQIQALTIDAGVNVELYPNLKVPTLEEFLVICKSFDLVPVIELVGTTPTLDDNYESFVNLLKKHNYEDTALVISFSTFYLRGIREFSKKVPMQIIGSANAELIDTAIDIGNCNVSSNYAEVNKNFVDLAHQNGLSVGVWTVNNYNDTRNYINYMTDFITSDIIPGMEV